MRLGHVLSRSVAIALLASPMAPALAQVDGFAGWTTTQSPDGAFAAEVPCSQAEIEAYRAAPEELGFPVPAEVEKRILCAGADGDYNFVAVQMSDPDVTPDGPAFFETLRDQVMGNSSRDGEPRVVTINGLRSLVNRETQPGQVAQTGIHEVDHDTIIFTVAGGAASESMDIAAAIDRFVNSLRVTR